MAEENITSITTILLLGLQLPQNLTVLVFCILLLISSVTLCGNLLIISVVAYSKTLHCPMYFFLCQLSITDILLVINIIPSILHTVLAKRAVILFPACFTQFFFFGLSETVEIILLALMSYDRYLAICKPLHYPLMMTHQVCWRIVITCWSFSILIVLSEIFTLLKLHFCGPNVVDHFFCDPEPILELSCTSTTVVQLEKKLMGAVFIVFPFTTIVTSYIYIIDTIFKIPSVTGRKKVFSTCSSHLTVVIIFYGALFIVYLVPRKGQLQYISKFLSLPYTVLTPLMNPVIYSLRNNDLKNAIGKLMTKS